MKKISNCSYLKNDSILLHSALLKKSLLLFVLFFAGILWTANLKQSFLCTIVAVTIWLLFGVLVWFVINNKRKSTLKISFSDRIRFLFNNWRFFYLLCFVSLIIRPIFFLVLTISINSFFYVPCTVFITSCTLTLILFLVYFSLGLREFSVKQSLLKSIKLLGGISYVNVYKSILYVSLFCTMKQVIFIYILPYLLSISVFSTYLCYFVQYFYIIEPFILCIALLPIGGIFLPSATRGFMTASTPGAMLSINNDTDSFTSSISRLTSGSTGSRLTHRRTTKLPYIGIGRVGGGFSGCTPDTTVSPILNPAPTNIANVTPILHNGNLFVRIVKVGGAFVEVSANQMAWFFNRANLSNSGLEQNDGRILYRFMMVGFDFSNPWTVTSGNTTQIVEPLIVRSRKSFTSTDMINFSVNERINVEPNSTNIPHVAIGAGLSNGGLIPDLENIIPFKLNNKMYMKIVMRDGTRISVNYRQLHWFFYWTPPIRTPEHGDSGWLFDVLRPVSTPPITGRDRYYRSNFARSVDTPNPSVRVSWHHLINDKMNYEPNPALPNAFPTSNFDTRDYSQIWQPGLNLVRSTGTFETCTIDQVAA